MGNLASESVDYPETSSVGGAKIEALTLISDLIAQMNADPKSVFADNKGSIPYQNAHDLKEAMSAQVVLAVPAIADLMQELQGEYAGKGRSDLEAILNSDARTAPELRQSFLWYMLGFIRVHGFPAHKVDALRERIEKVLGNSLIIRQLPVDPDYIPPQPNYRPDGRGNSTKRL